MGNFRMWSPAFADNDTIPARYTCDGEDINPPLAIDGIPPGAKSLTLLVEDPDAPGGVWLHWMVWNINPHTAEIQENSVPREAIAGKNDFHRNSYGGPCPPSGRHRYFFRLYALDTTLDLAGGVTRETVEDAMDGHIIARTEFMGYYGRK